jgi:hypothetical protein
MAPPADVLFDLDDFDSRQESCRFRQISPNPEARKFAPPSWIWPARLALCARLYPMAPSAAIVVTNGDLFSARDSGGQEIMEE